MKVLQKKPPEQLRHLPLFLRALFGLTTSVETLPAPAQSSLLRTRYRDGRLLLPSAPLPDVPGTFANYLLAAAAHAGAHLCFGPDRLRVERLTPLHVAVISLLEDARVERLASTTYPGLCRLWSPYHVARSGGVGTIRSLLARLARALHDPAYSDPDAWVLKGRALFEAAALEGQGQLGIRQLGNLLANDLGQMRLQFNAKDYLVEPAYRDDNSGLWRFEESVGERAEDASDDEGARSVELDAHAPDAPSRRGPTDPVGLQPGTALERAREVSSEGRDEPARYSEWDYVIGRSRPAFCSVYDAIRPLGDPAAMDVPLGEHTLARRRLTRAAARLSAHRPSQQRRLLDGDRLEWPRALAALVARASASLPDPRVYCRVQHQPEPLSVLLLLDLSESLNESADEASGSLLQLARNASALFLASLAGVIADVAVFGFSSNGRHRVSYFHFKHFDEPFDADVRARLAGMRAEASTRLGAALRHAGRALAARSSGRKILLLVSDGEPSDVDVHDPEYLLADARQAVVETRRQGVLSYCIGLDPKAEPRVRRIFGPGRYVLLDRPELLPERLSELYQRLA